LVGAPPDEYIVGCLAETFEFTDPLTIVFHIRHGVMWTGNANIGMEPRELTAYDCEFSMNRYFASPFGHGRWFFVASIEATDKYTLVVHLSSFNAAWAWTLCFEKLNSIIPPEVVAAGAKDWRNQCGTGPFILTNIIEGSQGIFERNPNYWAKTTINGKEYETPFVDRLVLPIIPDDSTRLAALRTGKIDTLGGLSQRYKDTLAQTCPELQYYSTPGGSSIRICLRQDQAAYFKDINVRKALFIGLDMNAFIRSVWMDGDIHTIPIIPGVAGYTPLEELPAEAQELFTYDPVKAKKMLADAGYPNGFSIELSYKTGVDTGDIAAMVADYWSKLGITVTLHPLEVSAFNNLRNTLAFNDCFMYDGGGSWPYDAVYTTAVPGQAANRAKVDDPAFTAEVSALLQETDVAKRSADLKAIAIEWLEKCWYIPVGNPNYLNYYWPWVKNYWGVWSTGSNSVKIQSLVWINQDLKKSLGY